MFYAYIKQSGDGFGHAIGCGLSVERLDASAMAEAIVEMKANYQSGWYLGGERDLESAVILHVAEETPINLRAWRQELDENKAAADARKRQEAECAAAPDEPCDAGLHS